MPPCIGQWNCLFSPVIAATAALFSKLLHSLADKARAADIAAADVHAVGVGKQPRRLGLRHGWIGDDARVCSTVHHPACQVPQVDPPRKRRCDQGLRANGQPAASIAFSAAARALTRHTS